MTAASLTQTIALGTITGMRSMAGPAALALTRGGPLRVIVPVLAAGEMIADKLPSMGDRIDPVPLAGRAIMGALVGGVIAREARSPMLVGGLVGAATAVVAAYLAWGARTRLPLPSLIGGMLEDALVIGIGTRYARAGERR